jgi:ubiquinone/menaquinone biosynthesis C-methylase UbiE
MDGGAFGADELTANFRDIQRVNRWLGGRSVILNALPRLIPYGASSFSVLDVATGIADIPAAIERWAISHGYDVSLTATDVAPQVLDLATARVSSSTRIQVQQADARALPFDDGTFDVVTCSLALHHFAPADAVLVLREMDRVCRSGFVVNDLRRSELGFGASWLASRSMTRNRLTRHDAPLSVRRAYTPAELRSLLHEAGVRNAEVVPLRWFRMAAIKRAAHA